MKKAITLLSSLQGSQCNNEPTELFLQRVKKKTQFSARI